MNRDIDPHVIDLQTEITRLRDQLERAMEELKKIKEMLDGHISLREYDKSQNIDNTLKELEADD